MFRVFWYFVLYFRMWSTLALQHSDRGSQVSKCSTFTMKTKTEIKLSQIQKHSHCLTSTGLQHLILIPILGSVPHEQTFKNLSVAGHVPGTSIPLTVLLGFVTLKKQEKKKAEKASKFHSTNGSSCLNTTDVCIKAHTNKHKHTKVTQGNISRPMPNKSPKHCKMCLQAQHNVYILYQATGVLTQKYFHLAKLNKQIQQGIL